VSRVTKLYDCDWSSLRGRNRNSRGNILLNLFTDKLFFSIAERYGNKMRTRHGRKNFGPDQIPSGSEAWHHHVTLTSRVTAAIILSVSFFARRVLTRERSSLCNWFYETDVHHTIFHIDEIRIRLYSFSKWLPLIDLWFIYRCCQ
jgi:hypothetical protein